MTFVFSFSGMDRIITERPEREGRRSPEALDAAGGVHLVQGAGPWGSWPGGKAPSRLLSASEINSRRKSVGSVRTRASGAVTE